MSQGGTKGMMWADVVLIIVVNLLMIAIISMGRDA